MLLACCTNTLEIPYAMPSYGCLQECLRSLICNVCNSHMNVCASPFELQYLVSLLYLPQQISIIPVAHSCASYLLIAEGASVRLTADSASFSSQFMVLPLGV